MSVPFAVFGPGILIATRTDLSVNTPINVGYAQEFSIELAGQTKSLYGQKQFPLVAARGTIKATAKFKAATFSGICWNNIMFGETAFSTTSGLVWNIDSTFSVPGTTAYTVTVGTSTTFDANLGVKYSTSGLPFQRVSPSAEAAGKYSQTGNVLTFAAADASAALKVTWTSSPPSAGQSLIVTNKDIGNTPTFQLDYYTNLNQPGSKPFVVRIFQLVASKETLPFKLEDFSIPEFEADIFANASDQLMNITFPEVS